MVRIKRFHKVNSFTDGWFIRFLAERKLDGALYFTHCVEVERQNKGDRVITLETKQSYRRPRRKKKSRPLGKRVKRQLSQETSKMLGQLFKISAYFVEIQGVS